ncbi:MAG: hypothetical protein R3C19_02645 [Planctomycetaceae bacterium]
MSREQYQKAFVIQFGPETDPVADRFAGRVEHIASGRNKAFGNLDELHEFLAFLLAETITSGGESQSDEKADG